MNQQLSGLLSDVELMPPPPPRRIYVNRNLRMDTVRMVGFDMDYTIARYHKERIERLAHGLTVDKLIGRGYPEAIRDFPYDPRFVVRGLTVDKLYGNILKLDRHNHVARVFHGREPLNTRNRRDLYRRERVSFTPPRFAVVDTLFSLPEMCLYADLIDFFTTHDEYPLDPWRLFDDTRECIDEAHRDNSLKSVIKNDLPTYVEKDPLLARTLHKLRSAGKKLFLLTNSYADYTNTVMSYLLDHELAEYPSWRSYFEVTIVGAQKPDFFTGSAPLCAVDDSGNVSPKPVKRLERNKVYQGGNLRELESLCGFGGEEVLYVGDHIYGDILRSKKSSLWRTMLVVEELEAEIAHSVEHAAENTRLAELEEERRRLDDLVNVERRALAQLEQRLGPEAARKDPEFEALRAQRDADKRALKRVHREAEELRIGIEQSFNKNWGMVFKEEHENSRFGEQVAGYACLYTSRVSNFFHYSAHQYFRSPRDQMPHERL